MGKMTRTRRTLIAADMARMLRELQQTSAQAKPIKRAARVAHPAARICVTRKVNPDNSPDGD
jgi:hypothetical protein